MTRLGLFVLSGLAAALAACDGGSQTGEGDAPPQAVETAEAPSEAPGAAASEPASDAPADPGPPLDFGPDAVSLDPRALHAALLAAEDEIVPSLWRTGEPAPETALSYWQVPALDVEADRASSCAPLEGEPDAHVCVLSFTSLDERPVTARFRFSVRPDGEDAFTLISPEVRWAVQG